MCEDVTRLGILVPYTSVLAPGGETIHLFALSTSSSYGVARRVGWEGGAGRGVCCGKSNVYTHLGCQNTCIQT